MKTTHKIVLAVVIFFFLTIPLSAQEAKTTTVKKDSITTKAVTSLDQTNSVNPA